MNATLRDGFLFVEKLGAVRKQDCPFHTSIDFTAADGRLSHVVSCGLWCPHFFVEADKEGKGTIFLTCGGERTIFALQP